MTLTTEGSGRSYRVQWRPMPTSCGKRGRETHLVIWADRSGISADPARTPAPRLLDGIDVLWVLLGYFNAKSPAGLGDLGPDSQHIS